MKQAKEVVPQRSLDVAKTFFQATGLILAIMFWTDPVYALSVLTEVVQGLLLLVVQVVAVGILIGCFIREFIKTQGFD